MKRLICALMALLCLFTAGCRPRLKVTVREEEGSKIYFIRKDADGRKYIDYEKHDIKNSDLEKRINEMLDILKAPKSRGAYLEVPEHIGFDNITLTGNVMQLDFSRSYKYLSAESMLIVSTLICKTLLDDGIAQYIKITCEGEEQPPAFSGYIHQGKLHIDERMELQ